MSPDRTLQGAGEDCVRNYPVIAFMRYRSNRIKNVAGETPRANGKFIHPVKTDSGSTLLTGRSGVSGDDAERELVQSLQQSYLPFLDLAVLMNTLK